MRSRRRRRGRGDGNLKAPGGLSTALRAVDGLHTALLGDHARTPGAELGADERRSRPLLAQSIPGCGLAAALGAVPRSRTQANWKKQITVAPCTSRRHVAEHHGASRSFPTGLRPAAGIGEHHARPPLITLSFGGSSRRAHRAISASSWGVLRRVGEVGADRVVPVLRLETLLGKRALGGHVRSWRARAHGSPPSFGMPAMVSTV